MKHFSCILVSILLLFSCEEHRQKTPSVSTNKVASKISLSIESSNLSLKNDTLFYSNSKFSGAVYELYKNGDTSSVTNYVEGLQDGISKKWYANKGLIEIREYSRGEKNGRQIAYFENGKKKFEFVAKKDVYEGKMREWNAAGNIIHLANYKNGQEEGIQKMWYDNGKIRANYVMKNGKRYGLLGTKNCKNVSDSIFIVK